MTGDAVAAAARVLREACGPRAREAFPMAPLTTFRIGGPAALYLEAESDEDIAAAAASVAASGIPWTVIGKGSNLLVSDLGFPGLVLRLGRGFRWAARDGRRLRAGGSMPLPALAGVALVHGLTGLEFGVAIPASLGGAVRMNAGAHRSSMRDVVEVVEVFSMGAGRREEVAGVEAGFSYRRSALPAGSVVVGATLLLRPDDRAEIRARMDDIRAWRRRTQPLAEPNCGSVFKNPDGDHAARLVEAVGGKALAVGGAAVSKKHANFIVAHPGATSADVATLIRTLQRRVADRFGIALEPEVQFVGPVDDAGAEDRRQGRAAV